MSNTEKSAFSLIYFRESQPKESEKISSNVSAPTASRIFSPEKPVLSSSTPQGLRNRYNPRSQSKPPTFSVFDDPRLSSSGPQSQLKSDSISGGVRMQDQGGQTFSSPTPIYGLPINDTPYRPSSSSMDRMRDNNHVVSYTNEQQLMQIPSHRRRFDDQYMPSALTTSDSDVLLLNWVLILGINITSSISSSTGHNGGVTSTLLKLQEFGEIVDHIVGQGNWMFVKFESITQAERLIHQHVLQLTPQYIISLLPVTPTHAINFGLDMNYILTSGSSGSSDTGMFGRKGEYTTLLEESLTSSSSLSAIITDQQSLMGEIGASYRSINNPHGGPDEYLRPPKKTSNICSKIIEFFFFY